MNPSRIVCQGSKNSGGEKMTNIIAMISANNWNNVARSLQSIAGSDDTVGNASFLADSKDKISAYNYDRPTLVEEEWKEMEGLVDLR